MQQQQQQEAIKLLARKKDSVSMLGAVWSSLSIYQSATRSCWQQKLTCFATLIWLFNNSSCSKSKRPPFSDVYIEQQIAISKCKLPSSKQDQNIANNIYLHILNYKSTKLYQCLTKQISFLFWILTISSKSAHISPDLEMCLKSKLELRH